MVWVFYEEGLLYGIIKVWLGVYQYMFWTVKNGTKVDLLLHHMTLDHYKWQPVLIEIKISHTSCCYVPPNMTYNYPLILFMSTKTYIYKGTDGIKLIYIDFS